MTRDAYRSGLSWYRDPREGDTNDGPRLENLTPQKKRRIKHVLHSGLVIEVEPTRCDDLAPSPAEFTSHVRARTF